MDQAVNVGDRAPDFALPSQTGASIRLSNLLKKGPVVLYFYGKDESSGCTKEACAFRDSYEAFKDAGAEVIGISADPVKAHEQFAENHQLPFLLLSDHDNAVRKKYGVSPTAFIIPGRVTYVIDRHGIVRHIFRDLFGVQKHVTEAMAALRSVRGQDEIGS